jgi:adenine-specific DNA-methyltransferase
MARKKSETTAKFQKPIEQYEHKDKQRLNNPPVGLVDAHTDNGGLKKTTYSYDPHIDPQLQWAGKAEHTNFEVPVVSLHVHERIDPRRIIEAVRKEHEEDRQLSLFESEKKPLREAIEFYKHRENWSNRLIAGDSLLVMNSLLEKEGMGGKVQMVYFDPPYGIKYGSNFQPFVNKRDVKDGKDEDLTSEPEMLKAFRDTWELGIHSYLTYLRDRLLLARELLHDTGSIFVQISDENVHRVRCLLDEIFGGPNFISLITFQKTTSSTGDNLSAVSDYLLWYKKEINYKFRQLYFSKSLEQGGWVGYNRVKLADGTKRMLTKEEKLDFSLLPQGAGVYKIDNLTSSRPAGEGDVKEFVFDKKTYSPGKGTFKTDLKGLNNLANADRIEKTSGGIYYVRYYDDFPYMSHSNLWDDTSAGGFGMDKIYAVQTNTKVIERCILMSTDPGDLILDITCGSGTSAIVAEQWGRRWITCDTSRIAITLTKQRLATSCFYYYELSHKNEGVGSGFQYKTIPHITLGSIANNQPPILECLYDQPLIDSKKLRVTGPFTVEAVPAPVTKSFNDFDVDIVNEADASISRSGETLRQNEWKDELLRTGVRAKGGKLIEFTRVETISGTHYLQAEAETKEATPKRVVICFGPEHAPLEQRTVELALEEAEHLRPKPQIVLFCAFQFDEEASKDIDETNWAGVTLLKAQMNADLLTDDLKKKRSSNESFWLIGQPDVRMEEIKSGHDKGKCVVEVLGFDYYNPKTGTVESGGKGDIAMWMLDTDYDGRSLFPSQIFLPMAGAKEGWSILAKNLKAEIDLDKIEAYGGTVSLPFTPGRVVAIKIVDARGIESLKIIRQ